MASLYAHWILPRLLGCACSAKPVMKQRAKVVPRARGRVLELGAGLGLNFRLYDADAVTQVVGIDPSPELRKVARSATRAPRLEVAIEDGHAEELPFPDETFDTVVCTFTLCSVQSPERALAEARRVLKPTGRLLFCEHGLAPDAGVARWQRRLEPVWTRLAGGCHLTRPVARSLEEAGFRIETLDFQYLPHTPRFAGWNEWGIASRG